MDHYTVIDGDTLLSIAAVSGIDWWIIAEANRISEPYTIYPGQVLHVPEPAPTPEPSPEPGGTLLFNGDFDTGDFSQWATIQNKWINDPDPDHDTYSLSIQNGGVGHETAARFEIRPGDQTEFDIAAGSQNERSELRGPASTNYSVGDERWYEFDFGMETAAFPPGETGGYHSVVMQWHGSSLNLSLDALGNLIVFHRWEARHQVIGPVDPGTWHSYVLRVVHSPDPAVGLVQAWRDGVLTVPEFRTATMTDSPDRYWKLGLYRGPEDFPQVLWYDSVRVTAP